jgi:hypothetical protein
MRLSKEIIDRKLNEAPDAVREAVMSEEVSRKLIEIGKKHSLHIDKLSILEEESLYAMLGLSTSSEFSKNLHEGLGLSGDEVVQIAGEINTSVIGVIREALQKSPSEDTPPVTQGVRISNPTKEEMLAEIENPTPVEHPISSTQQTPTATAHEFIAAKMAEPASMPAQKYTSDPYRESVS